MKIIVTDVRTYVTIVKTGLCQAIGAWQTGRQQWS